jgi:hypothetical protein
MDFFNYGLSLEESNVVVLNIETNKELTPSTNSSMRYSYIIDFSEIIIKPSKDSSYVNIGKIGYWC